MAEEMGAVLVYSTAELDGKPVTKRQLVMSKGKVVASPVIYSAIGIQNSAGEWMAKDKDGFIELSAIDMHNLRMQADPAAELLARREGWGISGHYVHETIKHGVGPVPVSWGTVQGEHMFRRASKLPLEDLDYFEGPEEITMRTTGWVLTNVLGEPLIALPYEYPKAEDAMEKVASYKAALTGVDEVYLDRIAPGRSDAFGEFVARIVIYGDQTPSEALNAFTGIFKTPRRVSHTPAESGALGDSQAVFDASL